MAVNSETSDRRVGPVSAMPSLHKITKGSKIDKIIKPEQNKSYPRTDYRGQD